MKVYLVLDGFCGTYIPGVFSTKELAEKTLEEWRKHCGISDVGDIIELELDKEVGLSLN